MIQKPLREVFEPIGNRLYLYESRQYLLNNPFGIGAENDYPFEVFYDYVTVLDEIEKTTNTHDPLEVYRDFLKRPILARANNIELWYAGGKNVNKLDFSDPRGLPIYYSCDWDFDGLFIIYPLVKEKIPTIQLLTPNGTPRDIDETEHNSKWMIKGRNIDSLLTSKQQKIINELIQNNQWIIEESNDVTKIFPTLHSS